MVGIRFLHADPLTPGLTCFLKWPWRRYWCVLQKSWVHYQLFRQGVLDFQTQLSSHPLQLFTFADYSCGFAFWHSLPEVKLYSQVSSNFVREEKQINQLRKRPTTDPLFHGSILSMHWIINSSTRMSRRSWNPSFFTESKSAYICQKSRLKLQ